ncbi:MAG: uracil phosphoribosyltransferase [Acidimicrobiales bacterium]
MSTPSLTVIEHPLVQHKVSVLRDMTTPSDVFRATCREITVLCAYETFAGLPLTTTTVTTPLTTMEAPTMAGPSPVVVGILRAGQIMVDAVLSILPEAAVGLVGMARHHDTHEAYEYYRRLPHGIDRRPVVVVDPMLATGGSAVHALDVLAEEGCSNPRLLSIIGCPEGVAAVHERHPNVPIVLAALDQGLNDDAYIVPGLGDAGDRLYGTT